MFKEIWLVFKYLIAYVTQTPSFLLIAWMHTDEKCFFPLNGFGKEKNIYLQPRKKSTTKIKNSIFTMPFFSSTVGFKKYFSASNWINGCVVYLERTAPDKFFHLPVSPSEPSLELGSQSHCSKEQKSHILLSSYLDII